MAVAVGDELAEAVGAAVGDRPQQVVIAGDRDRDPVVPGGGGLGQADLAVFRVGEAAGPASTPALPRARAAVFGP
jgi:hypothetical protein